MGVIQTILYLVFHQNPLFSFITLSPGIYSLFPVAFAEVVKHHSWDFQFIRVDDVFWSHLAGSVLALAMGLCAYFGTSS